MIWTFTGRTIAKQRINCAKRQRKWEEWAGEERMVYLAAAPQIAHCCFHNSDFGLLGKPLGLLLRAPPYPGLVRIQPLTSSPCNNMLPADSLTGNT